MTIKSLTLAAVAATAISTAANAQSDVSIQIDAIQCGVQIYGSVTGLTPDQAAEYKVLVFVRTNKWWIHPHLDGAEGVAWASISADGLWDISTISFGNPTSQVAALVVPMSYQLPRPEFDLLDQLTPLALVAQPAPDNCF